MVYYNQGKYDEALAYHEKCLNIQLAKLGQDHPDVATTYNNIAFVYAVQNKFNEALGFFKKSLEISDVKLGTAHPSTRIVQQGIDIMQEKLKEM